MRPEIAVMSAQRAGRYRSRYHAIVEVDRDVLERLGRPAPRLISERAAGLLCVIAHYLPVNQGPNYPDGKCAASRQFRTVCETARLLAESKSLPYVGVIS